MGEKLHKDRPWSEYPIGTKVHSVTGGYWIRVEHGWKWFSGDTFPTPGGDACGRCIELPTMPPLWQQIDRAWWSLVNTAEPHCNPPSSDQAACVIRAVGEWIEQRQVENYGRVMSDVRDVIDWLAVEADRAERGRWSDD